MDGLQLNMYNHLLPDLEPTQSRLQALAEILARKTYHKHVLYYKYIREPLGAILPVA